ncbi:hypothetical protein HYX06_02070 [Candidatus Woesearchaeota archaeon]|nr:hypothetical protein [Candidatus Woesearchaeota archaeon]
MGKIYSIAAGTLAAAIAASACAPRSVSAPNVPTRGGYALSDSMTQMCMDQAEGLAARLTENPSLATKGIEINVPSREYGACLRDILAKQTGKEYLLAPTDSPVYFTLTLAPEK